LSKLTKNAPISGENADHVKIRTTRIFQHPRRSLTVAATIVKRLFITALAVLAGITGPVAYTTASAATLSVPQISLSTRNTIHYVCKGGKSLTVNYYNARNEQSFALLSVKGKRMLFVNVLSASGAKYEAGEYTWWTKGPEGTLSDALADEKAPPLLDECKVHK
jgi:membrane-bound inhibitor of C-type lysozyme